MKYYRKDPLRELSEEERSWLGRISRSQSEPAAHVIRAKEILLVAQGHTYSSAARLAGRKSGDAVCHLVKRFNQEGLNAIQPGHGVGRGPSTELRNGNGSCGKCGVRLNLKRMVRRTGLEDPVPGLAESLGWSAGSSVKTRSTRFCRKRVSVGK